MDKTGIWKHGEGADFYYANETCMCTDIKIHDGVTMLKVDAYDFNFMNLNKTFPQITTLEIGPSVYFLTVKTHCSQM